MAPTSRAAAQRRAAEIRQQQKADPELPTELEAHLATYTPDVAPSAWAIIKPVHNTAMRRSGVTGAESFRHRCRDLAAYLAWRHDEALTIGISEALTFTAIDDYFMRGMGNLKPASQNDRRSKLRRLAIAANPSLDAPPAAPTIGKVTIKAPYDAREEASIKRVALHQRNKGSLRNLCAIVGLCGGAGLNPTDLRELRCRHIIDHDTDGIEIDIPGKNPRRVWVRHDYEDLVRVATTGRRAGDLVIGTKANRSNITGNMIDKAEVVGDVPHIEAARLRSTWLAWLITRPVPLNVILNAAGLKTARTIIDLIAYLPDPTTNTDHLRGTKETT